MAKNVFRLEVWTTKRLVAAGAYNYANPNITSNNFPLRSRFMGEREIVLIEFDREMASDEVLSEAKKQGLERPVYEDALRFGVEYPDVQRGGPVVFLHKPWRNPDDYLRVLYLWGNAGDRELRLHWFDDRCYRFCRFAFVRKSK